MLKQITQRLSSAIEGITQRVVPLATQRTTSDGKTFPAIYSGKGQYSEISPDNYAGLSYFRINGKTRISDFTELKRSCDEIKQYEYPIRLVACIKNELTGTDDGFTSDALALTLIKELNGLDGSLKQDLSANFTSVKCVSYDTDVKDILTEEYKGIDRLKNSIPYEYSLVAIDIEVQVVISTNCIELLCKTYC